MPDDPRYRIGQRFVHIDRRRAIVGQGVDEFMRQKDLAAAMSRRQTLDSEWFGPQLGVRPFLLLVYLA